MNKNKTVLIILGALLMAFTAFHTERPTLYIIGDSTVRNTNKEQWGWGTLITDYFDTTQLAISNQAMAGRSTRTFIKEGRWEKVLSTLRKGDYVFMQFGHNEGSKPDTSRSGNRGVLRGTSNDSIALTWPDGKIENVHTYGFYLRKFVREAKAKGATPVILSMIPRNIWKDGKVPRAHKDFGLWAKEIATQESITFIDLNAITADKYDNWGAEKVKELFAGDHTHTSKAGANVNAQSIVEGIRKIKKIGLQKFLIK